jgi:hypothetical protein
LALKTDYNRRVAPTSPRSPSDTWTISSEYGREIWSSRYHDSKIRIDDKIATPALAIAKPLDAADRYYDEG